LVVDNNGTTFDLTLATPPPMTVATTTATYDTLTASNGGIYQVKSGATTTATTVTLATNGGIWETGVMTGSTNLLVASSTSYILDRTRTLTSVTASGTLKITKNATSSSLGTTVVSGTLIADASGIQTTDLTITGTTTHSANTTSKLYSIDLTVSGTLTLNSGAVIDGNGKGYSGANQTAGNGPGGGGYRSGGAGYGGEGGIYEGTTGGATYGSSTAPTDLGSQGGSWSCGGSSGGSGGGAILLTVSGTSTINGTIRTNGGIGNIVCANSGGGSGGSIYLTTAGLAGSGTVTANGGNASGDSVGAGGGGRIALIYTSGSTTALTKTAYGATIGASYKAAAGTIFTKGPTNTYGDLVVDNGGTVSTANTNVWSPTSASFVFDSLATANAGRVNSASTSADQSLTVTTLTNAGTMTAGKALTISGNFNNTGTFTADVGTTTFSGTSAQAASGTFTGSSTFNNLVFVGAGAKSFSSNVSASNVSINSGATVVAPANLTVSGNFNNSGTFTHNSGTTTFSSSTAQVLSGVFTGNSAFNHVVFSGTGPKTFSVNASTSNLTINSGATVVAPVSLTIGGNYINNGTFTHNSGTATFSSSTAQLLSGNLTDTSAFNHVIFAGASTKTLGNNASTSNLTINSGATVIAPTLLTIGGDYSNSGTFTAGSGTTTLSGIAQQILSGNMTNTSAFNNLVIRNTTGTGSTSQSIIFQNVASTTDTFTMQASTSVQFLASATSTFQNIALGGTAGQYVYLRSSIPSTRFTLAVPGIQKALTYVNVKDSNACPFNIFSNDGTSIDSGNNACWIFNPDIAALSSEANQVFTYNQATTTMSTLTITDGITPSITIANGIRIIIATTTANMRFDTTNLTPTFGGSAAGKVSSAISYTGNGEMLFIPVTTNFSTLDTLTISNLAFTNFNSVNVPASALGVRVSGMGSTTVSSDDKTVGIRGALTLADHTSGQVSDNLSLTSETAVELYAFKLTPAGENATISSLVFNLGDINSMTPSDLTNLLLYRDVNADKVYDGSDVAVGGAGALSLQGRQGTVTFSTPFNATTTQNYLLIGDTANVSAGDSLTPLLTSANIVGVGVTTALTLAPAGSIESIEHRKGGQSHGGGHGEVGGNAPPGAGVQGGGGGNGGVGAAEGNTGEQLGNEVGFRAPTTNGAPNNEWTSGASGIASDGVYTSAASSGLRQTYGNFGFSVPATNQITGVEVKFEAQGSTAAGTISARLSWNGGTNSTTLETTGTLTTSDVVYTLGSASDLWGRTWTNTEFNNGNFTLEFVSTVSGNTVKVDAVMVRVYHQAVSTTTPSGGGGGGEVMIPSKQHFASAYSAVSDTVRTFFRRIVNNFWHFT
jgi:hypothetical protein